MKPRTAFLLRNVPACRWLLPALSLLVVLPAAWAADRNLEVARKAETEHRVALVIGNGSYTNSPLRNPANDARAVAGSLKQLGFEVAHHENLGLKAMGRAIRDFGSKLKDVGGVGLFYYAGHGMQVNGRNYLIPVDADIQNEDEIAFNALDANLVLEKMDTANNRLNLVILDACRNNPFARSFRSAGQGLAQMDAPGGTLIAFATAPGSVAADGEGSNGIYTKHLVENMKTPGLAVEQLFKRVRIGVMRDTGERQVPWESSSLKGDFYFRAGLPTQVAIAAPPSAGMMADSIELAFWDSIRNSQSRADYEAYLAQYPQGRFATLARARANAPREPAARPASASTAGAATTVAPRSGDAWTYRYLDGWKIRPEARVEYRVTAVADKGIQQAFSLNGRQIEERVFRPQPALITRTLSETSSLREFGPYLIAFEALEQGKTWEEIPSEFPADDQFSDATSKFGKWSVTARVVGRERVAVPAGSFDAMKVVVSGRRTDAFRTGPADALSPRTITHTVWYVPEVKRIVKQTTVTKNVRHDMLDNDTLELVSYKLN
jgi:uncharacterized caspase-like protein